MAPPIDTILSRMRSDLKRPNRFQDEATALLNVRTLFIQGHLPKAEYETLLNIYSSYLSDRGF